MNEQAQSGVRDSLTFPLFEGGPFHRLLERVRLVQAGRSLIARRIVLIVLVTWVPLVMLALVQGFALGPTRLESLLMDFAANVRFLVTVPALLLAEGMCGARFRRHRAAAAVRRPDRGEEPARSSKPTCRDSVRLSRSGTAEAILLGLAYLHSAFVLVAFLDYPVSTWRTPDVAGTSRDIDGRVVVLSRSVPVLFLPVGSMVVAPGPLVAVALAGIAPRAAFESRPSGRRCRPWLSQHVAVGVLPVRVRSGGDGCSGAGRPGRV